MTDTFLHGRVSAESGTGLMDDLWHPAVRLVVLSGDKCNGVAVAVID